MHLRAKGELRKDLYRKKKKKRKDTTEQWEQN